MTERLPEILRNILPALSCQTGTIHRTTADGKNLELVCHQGVPDFLLERISHVPFGKGIAGAAAAGREPVELCNLQQDLGGIAKPDARQTGVSGSIALPVISEDGARVLGTLGVGMAAPHVFSDEEKEALCACTREIAKCFENAAP